jgi:hypothetical protein
VCRKFIREVGIVSHDIGNGKRLGSHRGRKSREVQIREIFCARFGRYLVEIRPLWLVIHPGGGLLLSVTDVGPLFTWLMP